MKKALVYDIAAREAGAVADYLERHDFNVIRSTKAEEKKFCAESLDLLVIKINIGEGDDGPIGSGHDYEKIAASVSGKIYEMHQLINTWLPALRQGELKRIAILTEKAAGIGWCKDRSDYARHMILAGIHMQAKLFFNKLRPEGFTMRCFIATEKAEEGVLSAGEYICSNFCYDEREPYIHSEENRFVIRDGYFREYVW